MQELGTRPGSFIVNVDGTDITLTIRTDKGTVEITNDPNMLTLGDVEGVIDGMSDLSDGEFNHENVLEYTTDMQHVSGCTIKTDVLS